MKTPIALVSGDIVLDSHLYGGIKTAASSFQEPGTVYISHLGGAYLTWKLLAAAADANGIIWDLKNEAWKKKQRARGEENAKREEENRKERAGQESLQASLQEIHPPNDLEKTRPQPIYSSHLSIAHEDLRTSLPQHLHSFGVWTSHLASKGAKDVGDAVWRVQKHFGYGPRKAPQDPPVFQRAKNSVTKPALILLDDGGISFRHESSRKSAWPDFSPGSNPPFIVLKMSAPLCRGELWPTILKQRGVANRLLVVVSAADLRREDLQIRQHLSWEQCSVDAICALQTGSHVNELLQAKHVVVTFGCEGALWLHREQARGNHTAELIFNPVKLEGDFSRGYDGTVYGFQTSFAVAIAHQLLKAGVDKSKFNKAIPAGIVSGLHAKMKLLELGHGKVAEKKPGFPIIKIGQVIDSANGGFVQVPVPKGAEPHSLGVWSILADSQQAGSSKTSQSESPPPPHIGLAQLTATFGRAALSAMPSLAKDKLFTVDRSEIESLRTLERLIREYVRAAQQRKPLSIGVFGPPGAGKSFGVKALAKAILGDKVPFLEFNLSQFKSPDELIGAFHRVRDDVLKGATPVAFWDEFDSQRYKWLQYLLAPMQDGAFQEGQVTHPIGKCIFIFAGGTASTLDGFGVNEPEKLLAENLDKLKSSQRQDWMKYENEYREFKLLKGPDFISRLHGHLDVLGPNPRKGDTKDCMDLTWPIRRALMLRGILGLRDNPKKPDLLHMDPGLLYALLSVLEYKHGARSFEKILRTLAQDRQDGYYHRSALPPDPLLDRETSSREFHKLMNQRNAFKTNPDIEVLAAAIHENYRNNAGSNGWHIKAEVDKPYGELAPDYQAANRAAARRIPDLLSLIDFKVVANPKPSDQSWIPPLKKRIKKHRERLAQAEHLGWNAERLANGWSFAPERNDDLKQHNLLVDWAQLSESDKQKDRDNMDTIPEWLNLAKYMAVPVK